MGSPLVVVGISYLFGVGVFVVDTVGLTVSFVPVSLSLLFSPLLFFIVVSSLSLRNAIRFNLRGNILGGSLGRVIRCGSRLRSAVPERCFYAGGDDGVDYFSRLLVERMGIVVVL